ncbi:MAG: TlpA disulfide reductase family protein [Verrucomicrobiota bacterium]|nr:TlpA disulfide reductase family protein [Verrucomicrobiota bacterium]
MKLSFSLSQIAFVALLLGLTPALATAESTATDAASAVVEPAPKITVKSLLEPDYGDTATFLKAIDSAKEKGTPDQLLLEARMVYPFNTGDFSSYESLLPLVEKAAGTWDFSTSELFKEKDGLNALINVIRASVARDKGDMKSFEAAIKEAFWLDPTLSTVLTKWIGDYRTEQNMKSLRLPLNLEISTSAGEKTTLAALVKGKKAILIDFWATWCGPCVRLMPELQKKSAALEPQGVVVAGMNTEGVDKAETFRKDKSITVTHWLVEPKGEPYSRALKIDSIPRMILVSPDGAVLFNGHPQDTRLNDALEKIGVKL